MIRSRIHPYLYKQQQTKLTHNSINTLTLSKKINNTERIMWKVITIVLLVLIVPMYKVMFSAPNYESVSGPDVVRYKLGRLLLRASIRSVFFKKTRGFHRYAANYYLRRRNAVILYSILFHLLHSATISALFFYFFHLILFVYLAISLVHLLIVKFRLSMDFSPFLYDSPLREIMYS